MKTYMRRCGCLFCMLNLDGECLLEWISVDERGQCGAYLPLVVSDRELRPFKKRQRDRTAGRQQ